MIELTLPFPPSVNHYKKPGRLIKTKNGKIYQTRINTSETNVFYHAVWVLICQLKSSKGIKPFDSATILSLELDVYPPDRKRRDIDNLAKVAIDSLQIGGLIPDDYQIARLLIQRMNMIPKGQVIVRVSELICT